MAPSRTLTSSPLLRLACAVSLAVHLCALGALAAWSFHPHSQSPQFGASRGVAVIEASFSEPRPTVERVVPQEQVLILPERAQMQRRQYVHTSADRVPLEHLLTRDVLDRLLDADGQETVSPAPIDKAPPPDDDLAFAAREITPPSAPRPSHRRPEMQVEAVVSVSEPLPAADAGVRVGPSFAGNRPPHYPPSARQRGWEGIVMLRLTIDRAGRVSNVEIARSSGYEILDAAAASAVRTWRGAPATINGRPVETVELLPVEFRLK